MGKLIYSLATTHGSGKSMRNWLVIMTIVNKIWNKIFRFPLKWTTTHSGTDISSWFISKNWTDKSHWASQRRKEEMLRKSVGRIFDFSHIHKSNFTGSTGHSPAPSNGKDDWSMCSSGMTTEAEVQKINIGHDFMS